MSISVTPWPGLVAATVVAGAGRSVVGRRAAKGASCSLIATRSRRKVVEQRLGFCTQVVRVARKNVCACTRVPVRQCNWLLVLGR